MLRKAFNLFVCVFALSIGAMGMEPELLFGAPSSNCPDAACATASTADDSHDETDSSHCCFHHGCCTLVSVVLNSHVLTIVLAPLTIQPVGTLEPVCAHPAFRIERPPISA